MRSITFLRASAFIFNFFVHPEPFYRPCCASSIFSNTCSNSLTFRTILDIICTDKLLFWRLSVIYFDLSYRVFFLLFWSAATSKRLKAFSKGAKWPFSAPTLWTIMKSSFAINVRQRLNFWIVPVDDAFRSIASDSLVNWINGVNEGGGDKRKCDGEGGRGEDVAHKNRGSVLGPINTIAKVVYYWEARA